jgi:Na+/H+ antiporter NhaD/arsenite permease-like protein
MGYEANPWMMLPFGLLLAGMAAGPLLFRRWWENHYGKAVAVLSAITVGYYLLALPAAAARTAGHAGRDYLGFIALVGSLFVVSSGLHLRARGGATPGANVVFLLVGALLANVLGTVGASLLLIRPWLGFNGGRTARHHVIFFIFVVSNAGGCLAPLGNPPLLLGYLMGVPFWWVAEHCWPVWLCGIGYLLAVFYIVDCRHCRRNPAPPCAAHEEWRVEGLWNLVFLGVILAAVFIGKPIFLREGVMVAAAAASWFTTRKAVREANQFDFHPIIEVAVLFLGIFATMMPALDWLQNHAERVLGANPPPALFYWSSGAFSSLLDNAPAYLSFFSVWLGTQGQTLGEAYNVARLLGGGHAGAALAALSVGSVFFGGCTYIGNGPNFMVKAIAERQGVSLPGFAGYIAKWTVPVLLPLLVVIWLVFFR